MKKYIIPSYTILKKVFLVSPINVRENNGFFEEFCNLIKIISNIPNSPDIVIVCKNEEAKEKTIECLKKIVITVENIEFYIVEISDIWIRDYFSCGNAIEEGGKKYILKAIYNPNYNSYYSNIDDAAGIKLSQSYSDNQIYLPFKLDGGNIIANDEYIFISEKIYSENHHLSKKEIDNYFEQNFIQKLITLPIEILDVIGHTDSILRFVDDRTIALPIYSEDYRVDNRYIMKIRNILIENLGIDYKIIFLPSYLDDRINDDNIFSAKGLFINWLDINGTLIIPSFKELESYQREIYKILKKETNKNIIFSPADNYSFEGGCFNCISNAIF